MAGLLGSLFGSQEKVPSAVTVNPTTTSQQASAYNQSQIGQYESYAPGFTSFIQNLYNQTVNPQATQAQNTQYNVGNQLATQGYTNAQNNFLQYSRTLGLENAAATGAPVSGSFAQGLGTNIGMQQILQNQLQGTNLLQNYSQNQQNLAQSFMQPAQGVLQNSLSTPGQFLQAAQYNAGAQNQMNLAAAQANAQANPFGNFLTSSASTLLGGAAGALSGGFFGNLGQGFANSVTQNNNSPYANGYDSQGYPIAALANP